MRRKLISLALFFSALAVMTFFVARHLTLEELVVHEIQLRQTLADYPLSAVAIGLGIYVLASLVPGTSGKSLVYGWLFGFWRGVLLVNFGLTVAALITFFLSRYALREFVEEKFGYYLYRVNKAVDCDGAFYLFALRVVHAPYTFMNYALGATAVRPRTFWWATQLGMLPGNLVFVYAGVQLPSLKEVASHGLASVITPELIGAFVLLSVFPIAVRFVVRRIWPPQRREEVQLDT